MNEKEVKIKTWLSETTDTNKRENEQSLKFKNKPIKQQERKSMNLKISISKIKERLSVSIP